MKGYEDKPLSWFKIMLPRLKIWYDDLKHRDPLNADKSSIAKDFNGVRAYLVTKGGKC